MFNNFSLHNSLQRFSGIDLTQFRDLLELHFPEQKPFPRRILYQWARCWMGLKPSPFWSARFYYLMEEYMIGNHLNPKNSFRWDRIILNLPGSDSFNPTLPFVIKWDSESKLIAASIRAYVDDLRVVAATKELAWQAARQTASVIQYLGSQDASRKRRLDNGPWAGTMFSTSDGNISKSVTKSKWEKGKQLIRTLVEEIKMNPDVQFEYKRLERIRGFICHLAMTFDIFFAYLKGFHLSLSQHLPHRNEQGWKLSDLEWIAHVEQQFDSNKISFDEKEQLMSQLPGSDIKPPKMVKPVLRFYSCLNALDKFFEPQEPPVVHMRSKTVFMLAYGFCDASGTGFGSTLSTQDNVTYRMGIWGRDDDSNSSNWKEFQNLVETLEHESQNGALKGALVIFAVDNATVESNIYKGNSSSPKLFDLIIRFKHLELHSRARFIVSHVSGRGMKQQGTDGVSRGNLKEGVSVGHSMLSFCPWHLSALERNSLLKPWISSWLGENIEYLQPKDWFIRGHDLVPGSQKENSLFWTHDIKSGTFVWAPPPAAASSCLEELRKARVKRQQSLHVVLIPRLMTPMWLKQLYKTADLIFQIKPEFPHWSAYEFEPLTVALVLPYLPFHPWQYRSTPKMFCLARKLCQMSCDSSMDGRDILREFLLQIKKFPSMSPDVVRRLLYFGRPPPVPHSVSATPVQPQRPRIKRKTQLSLKTDTSKPDGVLARKKRRPLLGPI